MTTSTLGVTVEATHQSLEDRLRRATGRASLRGRARDHYAHTDTFLATTSRHLAAVDEVLLPVAADRLPDGKERVHDYLEKARALERALATLKARLYGEAHTVTMPWRRVWRDVEVSLAEHNAAELALVQSLLSLTSPDEQSDVAERVYRAELRAPTRPHPYLPHTGVFGRVARRMWSVADRFWDTAEGRVIPEPVKPPSREHSRDSLMAQWLMAEPHFDANATVFNHHHDEEKPAT